MGRDEFIARGASMISREKSKNPVPYGEILNDSYDYQSDSFYRRNYTEYEPYVDEYMQRYGEHLYFIEGGLHGKTAMDIAGQVEAFKKEHDVRRLVIIVDYLQLLKADPEDRAQRDAMSIVSAAVVTLKSLASQYGCTVFAITSMSNAQKGARVTDSAGKYSGDISYTAGVFLGWNWKGVTDESKEELRREEIQQCKERGYRVMILEVLKQRSGERDREVEMFYYPAYNYLTAPAVEGKSKPHKCENRNQKRR
jgi:replicative DNA helicase